MVKNQNYRYHSVGSDDDDDDDFRFEELGPSSGYRKKRCEKAIRAFVIITMIFGTVGAITIAVMYSTGNIPLPPKGDLFEKLTTKNRSETSSNVTAASANNTTTMISIETNSTSPTTIAFESSSKIQNPTTNSTMAPNSTAQSSNFTKLPEITNSSSSKKPQESKNSSALAVRATDLPIVRKIKNIPTIPTTTSTSSSPDGEN